MTYEEFMNSPGSRCHKDGYVILDIYDFARILTQELRERKFLYPDEYIHPLDIADLFSSTGYYLTAKRKNGKTNIFWSGVYGGHYASLDDEAFWLCTARAEKQKGIEMW